VIVLGLTGSIAMGKSKAAAALRRLGLPMHDSDAEVHRLLSTNSAAVAAVAAAFPGVVRDGAVDRRELGRRVFADPAALRRLEAILHPLVRRAQRRFLARAAARRRGGADARCSSRPERRSLTPSWPTAPQISNSRVAPSPGHAALSPASRRSRPRP
jgi:hypothetical protein